MTIYCYFCDSLATSKEHIPPRCLFPEKKDLPDGIDYRKDLITVPSCHAHNSEQSKEDEYLHFVLLHGYFNNRISQDHFNSKIVRAMTRRPALLFAFYETQMPVIVDGDPTLSVEIDRTRFENSLERIVQGLIVKNYGLRWSKPIKIYTPLLLENNQPEANKFNCLVTELGHAVINRLRNIEKRGANPEIFWYQLFVEREKDYLICRMMFYGGFDIFAVSSLLLNYVE